MESSTARTDSLVEGLAARQHGVIARTQLLERGVSAREVQYRLETGRLRRLHAGVYAVGPVPGLLQQEMAATLACGRGAVVSHWSAAGCWEIARRRPGHPVAVSTLRDVRSSDAGIRVFRTTRLRDDETTLRDGLPLTSPARTLFDLAGWAYIGDVERAFSRAVPTLVTLAEIDVLLERYPRRRGRRRLRALLQTGLSPGLTRSDAEREFLRVVRSGGLPRPATNVVIAGYEVDCLWSDARLVVEIDGRAYHSDARSFEGDRERDAALLAAGYRVMRVTWRQISDQPRPLLVRLAGALARSPT
ncbi:MAG: DUF559 domain-containing protein [Candidatus Longimicrobiales bacterium M2_2A_002]